MKKEKVALKSAEELVKEVEGILRVSKGWRSCLVPLLAGFWSLFQLAIAKHILLSSTSVRAIHLAFALSLVYLSFPAIKNSTFLSSSKGFISRAFSFLGEKKNIPFMDILLACFAACAALYLYWDYEGIASRQGLPNSTDIFMGISLVVLLLEAARRSLGLALPVISVLFISYSFFSESMPSVIAFKNASWDKIINKLTMGTEGIYGVPLDVSASTVFLFVLFGAMLERAGGGKFFIDLAFSALGKYRGGPAKAAVLASGLTGLVSGSSIANTVTTGTFTIPLMKKSGYSGVKAGAIEVAASCNGQIMPPIMGAAAFIIAETCGLKYFEVVKAAFIPAIISYIALIYITHLEALKFNIKPIAKDKLPHFLNTLKSGVHFLIPLFFLLYQLIIARRSASLSAYYAILSLAALVVLQEFWKARKASNKFIKATKSSLDLLWKSLVAGGQAMMTIGVAVAAAGIIVGIVTLGLGGAITEIIEILASGNLILLLIITAIVSLILGMGLPTTANYIVMATLTAPVIVELGTGMGLEVPLIAAHLFVFYFGILADVTPPVGLSAFAAAAISGESPIATGIQGFKYSIRTALLPFIFIFNLDLLLIGVNSFWDSLVIFITSLVAMFAFASITQNYFVRKNRVFESILLFIAAAFLLRPQFFADTMSSSKAMMYVIGLCIYFMVFGIQKKVKIQTMVTS